MEFKTYNEKRLDDHIELVNDVIKNWEWISWYPTKEQLKETYSKEGFTRDTRHYLYDNEKLVGFLSSAVEEEAEGIQHGSIHRLYVRKGYEHVEDKIMKKTLDELKVRGVKVVRTNIKLGMGNLKEVLERWGFGDRTILDYSVIFPVKDYVHSEYQKPNSLIDIDFDTNIELLIEAMSSKNQQSKEEITKRLDALKKRDRLVAAVVVRENDENLSYAMIITGNKPERAFMTNITILKEGTENFVKEIFTFLVQKAHKAGKEFLYHQITDFDLMEFYKELDLKFVPSYKYILKFD